MPVELKIPAVGESVTEALISRWFKKEGDSIALDEPVVELETDKVTVELPSPVAGKLVKITMADGETAKIGDVIGLIEEGAAGEKASAAKGAPPEKDSEKDSKAQDSKAKGDAEPAAGASEVPEEAAAKAAPAEEAAPEVSGETRVMPAAQRVLDQHGLSASSVPASGPGGRLLKEDVDRYVKSGVKSGSGAPAGAAAGHSASVSTGERIEELVAMSPIRKRIAERLVEAQHTAALLTTFNEIDMSAVIALRKSYQEAFVAKHEVKLGFMSFFVKACVDALKAFPRVNAEIRGSEILYRNYFDIGIAVSTDRGLMVPVIRNAEGLGFAEIEKTIGDFGGRARQGKIKLQELEGGTFTITNGGIFGSLLSTPIVNPPQSGVLGLHAIQERPVAIDGQVVIRPMMYVALTYDHRIVDGREAVTFLVRVKEAIEDPSRILLEV